MKDLHSWIRKILNSENLTCGKCDKLFSKRELASIGIQKSSRKPYKEILFIGIICKECGEMTIFELQEMTLLDLAFEILEEQSESHSNQKKKELDKEINNSKNNIKNNNQPKVIRSKITRKEIKDSVNFLQNNKYHEDFLVALGMSLDEIDKYKIKKKRKRKKNED